MAEINVRTIPEFDNNETIIVFRTLAETYNKDGADIEVKVTMSLPSAFTTGKSDMVDLTKELGKKHLGLSIQLKGSPGVTERK